jgi:2,3-bisphosphoglycerate-dependent phosphoglycerate mutase
MLKVASLESAQKSLETPGLVTKPLPKVDEAKATGPILYLFRHGETEDNNNKIFSGRRNSPLTARGVEQSKELAEKLKDKKIDLAIYSDLSRAKDTLDEVLRFHPKTKVEPSEFLLERDYGDLTGTSKTELNQKDPELCLRARRSWDFPPPNGESLKMVWENRVKNFCQDLEEKMRCEKINIAISCTNNTMRLIRMYFEKLSLEEMLELENPLASDHASYATS